MQVNINLESALVPADLPGLTDWEQLTQKGQCDTPARTGGKMAKNSASIDIPAWNSSSTGETMKLHSLASLFLGHILYLTPQQNNLELESLCL